MKNKEVVDYVSKLHPISLSFSNTKFENEFRQYHYTKSIYILRLALLTSIMLYAVFAIFDKASSPSFYYDFFVIRFYIVIPILILFWGISFLKGFNKYWQLLVYLATIISGSGIIYMLHRDPSNIYYYGGLFLIFMGGYFYIKLRFIIAVSAGTFLIFFYSISYFIIPQTEVSSIENMLLGNAFFIASNIICVIGLYSSEKLDRISFYQKNLLLKKQTEIENININLEAKVLERTKELLIAKEKAQQSDRLKMEFLHNMSHEIRTPMNSIMGFSELLNDSETRDGQKAFYASAVHSNGKQLLRIIDDILEISTLETKQINISEDTFSLNNLLKDLFSVFEINTREKKIPIYLKTELTDEESIITSDRLKLNKILSNLLENAFKFTNQGYIEIGYSIKNNTLVIYVKDTGIGIPTENKELIFNRFSQGNKATYQSHEGLGLGLSIAKENSELIGGKISVESQLKKGSTFYVAFPFKAIDKTGTLSKCIKRQNINNSKNKIYKIVIAEDEEVNYLYYETIIKKYDKNNMKVIHAKNGQEAVDFCRKYDVDLVLMDIKMPIMNGYDATKKIKDINPNIPIIAQTAYSTASDKEIALKHGCNGYVSKPIDKEAFYNLLSKYLKNDPDTKQNE